MCVKGYFKKTELSISQCHAHRNKIIETLVSGGDSDRFSEKAEWLIEIDQESYTPLHWLAFWNDFESINFLLKQIKTDEPKETMKMLVRMNSSLMTPLDIAGTHESHESAYLMIDYFF